MIDQLFGCEALVCQIDKIMTQQGLFYNLLAFVGTFLTLWLVSRRKKHVVVYYLIMFLGCFLFDMLTAPMSHYIHLGEWAYIYRGVSWVMIMGFATILFAGVNMIDYVLPMIWSKIKLREWQKYLMSVGLITVVLIFFEQLTVFGFLNVRVMAPETLRDFETMRFFGTNVSGIEIGWTFVLAALLVAFYKYLSFAYEKRVFVPVKKAHLIRNTVIALIGITLFELMISPMVTNVGFPSWTFFIFDITLVTVLAWAIIVAVSDWLVNKVMLGSSLFKRFVATVSVASLMLLPLEWFFIERGYRVYTQSTMDNLSGFNFLWTNLPLEMIFSALFYMALVVAFVKYWAIILDNKRLNTLMTNKKISQEKDEEKKSKKKMSRAQIEKKTLKKKVSKVIKNKKSK